MAGTDLPLRVAIVHYHLRRGGVTRVIESAREALKGRGIELLILSGEDPRPEAGSQSVRVIPALNYRRTGNADIAESLAEALKAAAEKYFGGSQISGISTIRPWQRMCSFQLRSSNWPVMVPGLCFNYMTLPKTAGPVITLLSDHFSIRNRVSK